MPTNNTYLREIAESTANTASGGGGFLIPEHNSENFAYIGATNNVDTIIYKQGATTVATLTFAYVADGVDDDDQIESITLS